MAVALKELQEIGPVHIEVPPPILLRQPSIYPPVAQTPARRLVFIRTEENPLPKSAMPWTVNVLLQTPRKDLLVETDTSSWKRLKSILGASKLDTNPWQLLGGEIMEGEFPVQAAYRHMVKKLGTPLTERALDYEGITEYGFVKDTLIGDIPLQVMRVNIDTPTTHAVIEKAGMTLITQKRLHSKYFPQLIAPVVDAYNRYTADTRTVVMTGAFPAGAGTN